MHDNSTTKNNYLVSVVVPFHNAEKTIASTLDSLTNQTLKSLEIVCVDDGSTDDSAKIVSQMSQNRRNHPIKLVKQENQGVYNARLTGIKASSGKYIGFCDADDIAEKNMFQIMLEKGESTNSDIVVCAYFRDSLNNVSTIEMSKPTLNFRRVDHTSGWIAAMNTSLWNKLIKREIAEQFGLLDDAPRITEDALYLLSIYPHIDRMAFVSTPLYHYRTFNSKAMIGISVKNCRKVSQSWLQLRNQIKSQFNEYLSIFDLAAFIHLGISLPLLLDDTKKEKKRYLRELKRSLDYYFPKHQKNSFFSIKYVIRESSFMFLPKIAHSCFTIHVLYPLLKLYNFVQKHLKMNIKW